MGKYVLTEACAGRLDVCPDELISLSLSMMPCSYSEAVRLSLGCVLLVQMVLSVLILFLIPLLRPILLVAIITVD